MIFCTLLWVGGAGEVHQQVLSHIALPEHSPEVKGCSAFVLLKSRMISLVFVVVITGSCLCRQTCQTHRRPVIYERHSGGTGVGWTAARGVEGVE